MSFAIWSSLGRREHAMDRATKILNIAIEIGERCELHICSLCVVKGRHSNHCWRWHLQPAAVTPSKRLMPENNRGCMPSKTGVSIQLFSLYICIPPLPLCIKPLLPGHIHTIGF